MFVAHTSWLEIAAAKTHVQHHSNKGVIEVQRETTENVEHSTSSIVGQNPNDGYLPVYS